MSVLKALIAFDKGLNFMLDGDPNETLSSRAWRMEQQRQPYWFWTRRLIDSLFFWQEGHCLLSYQTFLREQEQQKVATS